MVDYAFLNGSQVLLLSCERADFPEFPASRVLQRPPVIRLVDLATSPERQIGMQEVQFRCAFEFPALAGGAIIHGTSLLSSTATAGELCSSPFRHSRLDRLFVIPLDFVSTDGRDTTTIGFFTLSSTIYNHPAARSPMGAGRLVPWKEWGTAGARVHSDTADFDILRSFRVFGHRFVIAHNDWTLQKPQRIQVLSFNQAAIRRAIARGSSNRELIVTEVSSLSLPGLFLEPVESSLPYCSQFKERRARTSRGFMEMILTEDAIVSFFNVRPYRTVRLSPLTIELPQTPDGLSENILSF